MGKTLLLADDSVTMQKVVGITFANEDIDLVTVDNGDAALERARAIRPDVVLADVGMPGLSGYELCEALKRDPNLRHVRVILLTGTFDTYDEARAREVGADAHVSKPFEAQALVDQVHALLNAPAARAPEPAPTPAAERRAPAQAQVPPRPAPARPTPPPVLETPELDFESLDLQAPGEDTLADDTPSFEAGLDDFPAPAPKGAETPSIEVPDVFDDPHKTQFLDPRSTFDAPDLMPADLTEIPDLSGDIGADMKTTLLPNSAEQELFGPAGEPFDGADLEAPDFSSSGVFGDPSEDDLGVDPDTGFGEIPEVAAPNGEDWDVPSAPAAAETISMSEPELEASFAPTAELIEEPEDLELTPSEELPWADPLDGEEPVTPSYLDAPAPMPTPAVTRPAAIEPPAAPPRPMPVAEPEPSFDLDTGERSTLHHDVDMAELPDLEPLAPPAVPLARERDRREFPHAGGEPARVTTDAASHRSAQVPIDPAAMRQALEKIAWEAFGPLSEQIVREVVKKVEAIAWETLPQIAERLVREELTRLRSEDDEESSRY